MNTATSLNAQAGEKSSRRLLGTMEILILTAISLVAILIILWFRAQLADQAVTNFDECKKLYGTVQGDNYKCQTINGDTYEIEP